MKKILSLFSQLLPTVISFSQANRSGDSLYKNSVTPPNGARPRVWWHWMNGNITKDGIRKDLEWMSRCGIGGFQNFDAGLTTFAPAGRASDRHFQMKGISKFSATYTKTIIADKNWFTGHAQLWLDLGDVKDLAEVIVNGKSLGIVWKQLFRVDITNALKAGDNKIEIKVTNLWVNRLIGDAQQVLLIK